jgi:hypothetical protein
MSIFSRLCYILVVLTLSLLLLMGSLPQSHPAQAARSINVQIRSNSVDSNHEINTSQAPTWTATAATRISTPTPSFTNTSTASRTNTALPSDDIIIMGQVINVCSGKGSAGVQIYAGLATNPLTLATVTDANGYYSREIGVTTLTMSHYTGVL